MKVALLGYGAALPEGALDQERAAELVAHIEGAPPERAEALQRLFRLSGVRRRYSVLLEDGPGGAGAFYDARPSTARRMERYGREAPALAILAARRALESAGVPAAEIDQLVTVSCTGFAAPGLDGALIERLELPRTVGRTHVGFMGCHGALNALRVAHALGETEPAPRVLVVAVELCTLHLQPGGDEGVDVANALFGDAAAALVTGPLALAPLCAWSLAASGSTVLPAGSELMTWSIGDSGFHMTLSPGVPALVRESLRPWLEPWLGGQGLGLEDVLSWAVHPGGPRVLGAVEAALGLPRRATAASRAVLAECGNVSSATLPLILARMRREDAPRPCVALGFGPGLAIEAALFL